MAQKSVRLNDAKPEEWDAVGESVSGKEAVVSDEGLEKFHEFNVHADTYIKSGIQQGDKITLQWRNDESLGIQVDEVKITSVDKDLDSESLWDKENKKYSSRMQEVLDSHEVNKPKSFGEFCEALKDDRAYFYCVFGWQSFDQFSDDEDLFRDIVRRYETQLIHIGDNPPNKKVTPNHGEWWKVERYDGTCTVARSDGQGSWYYNVNGASLKGKLKPICKMIEEK